MKIITGRITNVILIIISALIGSAITFYVMPVADMCRILYVSQDEITELEIARNSNKSLEEKELFFGKIEEAVTLATKLPHAYETRDVKVIYSGGKVSGKNVKSISGRIHKEIIERLK